MDISTHWFAGVAILAVLAGCSRDDAAPPAAPSAAPAPTARVVRVYNWSDYIDPAVVWAAPAMTWPS